MPVLLTVASMPVLAGQAQTASAYGSAFASAQPGGGTSLKSDPFELEDAIKELRLKCEDEARRLGGSTTLLGTVVSTTTSLLSTLLGLVDGLFAGTLSLAELRNRNADLYRYIDTYRSPLWPVLPTASFAQVLNPLNTVGSRTVLEAALDRSNLLGQFFTIALLNAAAGNRIDPTLLSVSQLKSMVFELNTKGYFEPTAGIRWDANKVVEWMNHSLGIRLA